VAWRVEQIEHVIAIGELQHSRRNGDATLTFELHPVGGGPTTITTRVHRTGFLNGAGVQQELLGQRGLAGVGVADDRDGAAPGRLGTNVHDFRHREVNLPTGFARSPSTVEM